MKQVTKQYLVLLMAVGLPLSACLCFAQPMTDRASIILSGEAALDDGLYSLAQNYFRESIRHAETRDEKAESILWLVQALYGEDRYQDMLNLLKKRSSWAAQEETKAGFVFWQGVALFEQANYTQALRILSTMPTVAGSDYTPRGLRLMSKCHLQMKQYKQALKSFKSFRQDYGATPEAAGNLLDWAGLLLQQDDVSEAKELLIELCDGFPDSAAAGIGALWLGRILENQGHMSAVVEVLTPLTQRLDIRPNLRAEAWFVLAAAQEAQTNLTAALAALEAGEMATSDELVRRQGTISKARLLIKLGRTKEGTTLLHNWIVSHLKEHSAAQVQLDMASLLLDLKQYEYACDEFQNYLDSFPSPAGQAKALAGKGWALIAVGEFSAAANAFERAYALSQNDADRKLALMKAGDAFFACGKYALAREKYHELAITYPQAIEVPQALFQAAECRARQNDIEGALEEFETFENTYPTSEFAEQAAVRLALLKEEAGDWGGALSTYNSAIAKYGEDSIFFARLLHGRGLVRYRLGHFSEAVADFEAMAKQFPDSELTKQGIYMRGWCLYLLGRDAEALALCRGFIDDNPDSPWAADVLFWLAEYAFNHGDYVEAEEGFLELSRAHPQGTLAASALFWAGRAANAQKEYMRAIEHYNELTQNYSASPQLADARFAQGDALSELGQFAGAILAFEEVIKHFPESYLANLARGRKGDCLFTLGSSDPARYSEALSSYSALLQHEEIPKGLRLQTQYKLGRCHEKMKEPQVALDEYMKVVYGFLTEDGKGTAGGGLWFTRAAFNAAAIEEVAQQWTQAARIYKRVVDAGVPAADEARKRMQRIQLEHELPL